MPSWDGGRVESAAEGQQPDHGNTVLAALATHLLGAAKTQLELGSSADVRTWMRATPFAAPDQERWQRSGAASDAGLE